MRLREQLALQPSQGELLLSRAWSTRHADAQAVVVGTYAVSGAMVYVSLKIVNPQGNQVVAAVTTLCRWMTTSVDCCRDVDCCFK